MKKILPIALLLVLFVLPVSADTQVPVLVNWKTLGVPGLLIDGSTYVPLRAVSESLGAKVEWDGNRAIITSLKEPGITGDLRNKDMVVKALQILKEKDPADYEFVCQNANEVDLKTEGFDIMGGEAWAGITTSTKSIRISPLLLAENDIPLLASCLVHEATHLFNMEYYIIDNKKDENLAYLRQITTLRILGADQKDIDGTEATRLRTIK